MRLIDAEELLKDCIFPSLQFERGMRAFIGDSPTIDAVPVSFLYELRDNAQNEEASLMIDEIIARWRMKHDH